MPSFGAADSRAVTNRVPTQTAFAPIINAAARPLPSNIPPAATRCTCSPVSGDLYFLQTSAQAGIKTLVGISPVWPPASHPWAQMRSAPASHALRTCYAGHKLESMRMRMGINRTLGCPTIFYFIRILHQRLIIAVTKTQCQLTMYKMPA